MFFHCPLVYFLDFPIFYFFKFTESKSKPTPLLIIRQKAKIQYFHK